MNRNESSLYYISLCSRQESHLKSKGKEDGSFFVYYLLQHDNHLCMSPIQLTSIFIIIHAFFHSSSSILNKQI